MLTLLTGAGSDLHPKVYTPENRGPAHLGFVSVLGFSNVQGGFSPRASYPPDRRGRLLHRRHWPVALTCIPEEALPYESESVPVRHWKELQALPSEKKHGLAADPCSRA